MQHYRLTLFVLAFVLTIAAGCSRTPSNADVIRLGYLQNDLHHLPVFIALEKGFFTDAGLQVVVSGIFRAGPEQMSAFAAHELDVGYVGLAPAATAFLNGVADISILAQVNIEGSAIVCRPDISSLTQLAGTTVAIPGHATMQDCLIQKGLGSARLTPAMLRLMVLKPPEMLPALTSGNIDCFIAWEPYPAQAVASGTGSVVARSKDLWEEHPCCVLIAQDRFARTRTKDTAKIIQAHRRACRFINDNPSEAIDIAMRYTGMPRKIITRAMEHMRYIPEIDREKAKGFADFLSKLRYLSPSREKKQLTFFSEH